MIDAHFVVDDRIAVMQKWLRDIFPEKTCSTDLLAGDASFRRYFRTRVNNQSFVVMDAPPEKENCDAFIAIANAFHHSSVRFPQIIASDLTRGFLLLSDFGDRQLLPLLNSDTADHLYRSAIDTLLQIQKDAAAAHCVLPNFDDALYWREFEILDTWYIKKHLNKNFSSHDQMQLKKNYQLLIDSFALQSTVFVHRDYHSRNIMLCDDNQLGILDFQDAVYGPITYDLVSLLKDCYIAWPEEKITQWVTYFYDQLRNENRILYCDLSTFMRWFDFSGLQRHLKCLGIFSRLYYRDNKEGYLKEMPRVLNYVMRVCEKYSELRGLTYYLTGSCAR